MSRLKTYPWLIGLVCLSLWLAALLSAEQNLMLSGQPIGADYITYWSASQMAEQGRLAEGYQLDQIAAVQQLAAPVSTVWGWFYPPTFAVLLAPITSEDYLLSLFFFSVCGLLVFAAAIRHIAPPARFLPALLLAPALFINLCNGQNAALTAGIAGLGLSMLEKRPLLSGLLLGVLTIKPQLALPLLLLLVLHREYQALISAMISAFLLVAFSIITYGTDAWLAWLGALELANQLNEQGQLPWYKMSSLFSFLKVLGCSSLTAQIAQAMLAIATLLWTWRRFRHIAATNLRLAAWIACSLTLSPHLFNYDMLWLTLCLAWLAIYADTPSSNITRLLMPAAIVIWIYPLTAPLVQRQLGFNIEWLTPLLMLWVLHNTEQKKACLGHQT